MLIISLAKDHLGKDASPLDRANDELGCAESVTEILNKAVGFPIVTGTWTLNRILERDRRFAPAHTPEPGMIAVAPTGMGKRGTIGHTWIVGEMGIWYSNDSYSGKWMANYTEKTAYENYTKEKGIPIYLYKLI